MTSTYLAQRLLFCRQFLSSRPTTRDPAERETECERRDPENACTTMLIQGVSTRALSLTPTAPVCSARSVGRTPRIGMAEDAPSGFLDYALSLPLRGILRSPLEMTSLRYTSVRDTGAIGN